MKSWPTMEHSPWRQSYLSELTYGEIYGLVNRFVPDRKLRILDVGCGWGSTSLELARAGHDVLGLDSSQESVQVAKRARSKSLSGRLEYHVADFTSWKTQDRYDLAIFSRVLHHIPWPRKTLEKVKGLLSSKGSIICVEYAYDRFDRTSAIWFYHIRRLLEEAGWFTSRKRVSDNVRVSVNRILREWQTHGRKERLNRFQEMYRPMRELFREKHFSWEPYIFWDLIMDMRIRSAETESAVGRFVKENEKVLIHRGAVSPILFCFVGEKRSS